MHLRITTENDAFQGDNGPAEVARILRHVADRIEGGETFGNLRDVNGNRAGDFDAEDLIPDEAEAETIDAAHGVTIAPVPASECGAGSVEWDVFREGEHVSAHETRDAAAQAAQELADDLNELAGAEAAFDAAGGRGVELADRIDALRARCGVAGFEDDAEDEDEDEDEKRPLAEWVAENRETIRAAVLRVCPNAPTGDEDLADWVANDEGLYSWALRDGVDV